MSHTVSLGYLCRNKFTNLSALAAQTFWVRAGILLGLQSRLKRRWHFWRGFFSSSKKSIASVDSSLGITWFLIHSLKMFVCKLLSRRPCRPICSVSTYRLLVLVYGEHCVRLYVISSLKKSWNPSYLFTTKGHFTVVRLVTWPWVQVSRAGGDLTLIRTYLLFSCKCKLVSIRTTWFAQ